jgi:hypothetical protein
MEEGSPLPQRKSAVEARAAQRLPTQQSTQPESEKEI